MQKGDIKNPYIDEWYSFKGQWDMPSLCGLKIVKKENNDRTIAVVTELYDENPGTSVTSWCPNLATEICDEHSIDPTKLIFVVQVPDRGSKLSFYGESFDIVSMGWDGEKFTDPVWNRISREELEKLIC